MSNRLLQTEQQKSLPHMPGLAGREAAGVRYSWMFPNMTFAAGVDALWVYEAYPLSAGQCLVAQTACFPPETIASDDFETRVQAYYQRLDAALDDPARLPSSTNPEAEPWDGPVPDHPLDVFSKECIDAKITVNQSLQINKRAFP